MANNWQVWENTRGRVMGICIIYQCADYGLELSTQMKLHSSTDNADNREFCQSLCDLLNAAGFANSGPKQAGALAFLKEWHATEDSIVDPARRRVDLTRVSEPWLERLKPKVTALYAAPLPVNQEP